MLVVGARMTGEGTRVYMCAAGARRRNIAVGGYRVTPGVRGSPGSGGYTRLMSMGEAGGLSRTPGEAGLALTVMLGGPGWGEARGVEAWVAPGLAVHTMTGAPGRANRLSRAEVGVWGSWGRGGRERGPPRGAGEGRSEPWGSAEWNLASAAGGVKESTEVEGRGPPDSRRPPPSPGH